MSIFPVRANSIMSGETAGVPDAYWEELENDPWAKIAREGMPAGKYGSAGVKMGPLDTQIDPGSYWLLNGIAKGKTWQTAFEKFRTGALEGKEPQVIQEENVANEVYKTVQRTAHLDDKQFNEVMQSMRTEMSKRPVRPEYPQLKAPSLEQGLLAGAGALLFPQHAFQIGASPFNAQKALADKQHVQNQMTFEDDMDARKERIGFLGQQLGMLEQRRRENYRILIDLAEKAEARGETKKAQALNLRANFNNADSEQEASWYAKQLRTVYKDIPGAAPTLAEEDAVIQTIRNKAKANAEKDRLDREHTAFVEKTTMAGIFNADYKAFRDTAVEVTQPDVDRFNKRRAALVEAGVPSHLLDTPVVGKTLGGANTAFDNQMARDKFEYEKGQDELSQAVDRKRWEIEMQAKGFLTVNPDGSYTVHRADTREGRRKQMEKLEKDLDDAKKAVTSLRGGVRFIAQSKGKDGKVKISKKGHEEVRDWKNKLYNALQVEWYATNQKRIFADDNAELITFPEFVYEKYRGWASMFGLTKQQIESGRSPVQPGGLNGGVDGSSSGGVKVPKGVVIEGG